VNPGDTVIVKDGVYTAATNSCSGNAVVCVGRGGTLNAWVTFKSEHKWGAKIDGQSNTHDVGFKMVNGVGYIRFQDFELYGMGDMQGGGASAFESYNGGHDVQIVGNNIHDIGRFCTGGYNGKNGIYIAQNNVTVDGNLIHDIGRLAPGERGCNPPNNFYTNHDHGVYASSGDDITIKNNIFYNNARGWSIQVYPDAHARLNILNNTFATPNPYRDGHIILEADLTTARIENNIFYQPTTAAIYMGGSANSDVVIANNITTADAMLNSSTPSGMTLSNNQVSTDPLFVNPNGLDFHLNSGSPAIDTGLSLPQVLNDFDGISRPQGSGYDIGAFEFQTHAASIKSENGKRRARALR